MIELFSTALFVWAFRIDSPTLYAKILPLAVAGAVARPLVPRAARVSWLIVLSGAGMFWVLGAVSTAVLASSGAALIGICYLRVGWSTRSLLLVLVGAFLAFCRVHPGVIPGTQTALVMLGSMFMFRIITFMSDLRHSSKPPDVTRAVCFFFILPNIAFPLFPVLEYSTLWHRYDDGFALDSGRRGVRWILRGSVHLLLYRLAATYVLIPPTAVHTEIELVRFMVGAFLLYLRVSGEFHIAAGILQLFGFDLPETHRWFWLANGFADFWRRINTYWKEFMTRVVFNPAYFATSHRGHLRAVVFATVAVFIATWALHAYQWFWLLGAVSLPAKDVLFWSLMALTLILDLVSELRHGRDRTVRLSRRRPRIGEALHVVATFAVVCCLWSMWSSASVGDWVTTVEAAHFDWKDAGLVSICFGVAICVAYVGLILEYLVRDLRYRPSSRRLSQIQTPSVVALGAVFGLPLVFALPLHSVEQYSNVWAVLTGRDAVPTFTRGYYESLTDAGRAPRTSPKQADWVRAAAPTASAFKVARKWYVWEPNLNVGLRPHPEILPGIDGPTRFTTNSDGVRGDSLDAQDFKVLAVGGSTTECFFLDDSDSWPHLLQDELNARLGGRRVWVGNIGRAGNHTDQHIAQLQRILPQLPQQSAVLLLVGANDFLRRLALDTAWVPYPFEDSLARSDVERTAFTFVPGDTLPDREGQQPVDPDLATVYLKWRWNRRHARTIRRSLPSIESALQEYSSNLERIVDSLRARNVRPVLITHPSLWRDGLPDSITARFWLGGVGDFQVVPGSDYYAPEALAAGLARYNLVTLKVCAEKEVSCVDMATLLRQDPSYYYDEVHFSTAGARAFSTILAKELFRLGLLRASTIDSLRPVPSGVGASWP